MQTKVCRVCKIEKELQDFHPNKQCRFGVVATCRTCTKIRLDPWLEKTKQKRHKKQNENGRLRKRMAVEKFGGCCLHCKGVFPDCVFEFHHLDPSQKDENPSNTMSWSIERMWKELDKCVMLCANCHKIVHWEGAQ